MTVTALALGRRANLRSEHTPLLRSELSAIDERRTRFCIIAEAVTTRA
jgi:hypothetical protein